MSAYLFMMAHQNNELVRRTHKPRRRPADDNRSISTRSSRSSRSSGDSHKTSSTKKPKKKFDMATSQYVPVAAIDAKLEKFKNSFRKIAEDVKSHHSNQDLNKYGMDHGDLFNEKNLNILRYTFFKRITNDYDEILKNVKARVNHEPKLKYVRKLKANKKREKESGTSLFESPIDTMSTFGLEDLGTISSVNESESDNETTREDDFTDFDNFFEKYEDMTNKKQCVKDFIKSNQFWNNVNQELRFNLMELSSTYDYFELLPNLHQLSTIYKEIIEYFLLNLNQLTCSTSGLTEEEQKKVSKHRFLYFRDFDYEWFKLMSNMHYDCFNNQARLNSTMSIHQDSDFAIHKNLVNKIIDTIIENLKTSITNSAEYANEIELWEKFLRFLMSEVVIKYYNPSNVALSQESLPEPNLDSRSRANSVNTNNSSGNSSNDSVFNSLNMSASSTEESIIQLTRNTKNLSLNLNSNGSGIPIIQEESVYGFSMNNIESQDDDDNTFTYKRRGFVIEPPTPRVDQDSFPTPLSTTFSVNSEDTNKLHGSRLIFSRLRKSKVRA